MLSLLSKITDTNDSATENLLEFRLPIYYLEDKFPIQESIKNDLELLPNPKIDKISLYNYLFNPVSNYENNIIPLWSEYYTPNVKFLSDTQYLIKKFQHISSPDIKDINNIQLILDEVNTENWVL